MTVARSKNVPLSVTDSDAETPSASETPAIGLAAFFEALDSSSLGDVSLGIYEVRPGEKRDKSYLMQLPGEDVDPHTLFDFVLEKYGAGQYEALAKRDTKFAGSWRFAVGRKPVDDRTPLEKAFSRAKFIRPPLDAVAVNTLDVAAPFAPAAPRDKLDILIEQNARLLAAIESNAGGTKPQGSLDSMRDFVTVIAMVKEMFPQQAPAPTSNVLDIVKDVLKLKKHLTDDDGDSDPMARALGSLMPMLTNAIEKLDSTQPQQRAPIQRRPGGEEIPDVTLPKPLTTPTSASVGPQQVDVSPPVSRAVRDIAPLLPFLLSHAERGSDADFMAQTVMGQLDQLDDEKWNDAAELIFHPLVLNLLAGVEPKLAHHEAWLREVVTLLQQHMHVQSTEPDGIAEGDLLETGPSDIPDATSDAET